MWPRVVQWWRQIGSTRRLTQALLWESQETNRLLRELIERQTGFRAVAAVGTRGGATVQTVPGVPAATVSQAWNLRDLRSPAADSPPASPPTPSGTPHRNATR